MTDTTDTFAKDFGLSGVKRARPTPPGFQTWDGGLITTAGAYRDVPNERYHGEELCAGPSISATGLKVLACEKGARTKGQTPRHYWEGSNLNPKRKPAKKTDALRLGGAFHDALLLPDLYDEKCHVLPAGFSRAASVKQAAAIAEADAAIAAGMIVLKEDEAYRINAMVDALRADTLIAPLLGNGEAEVTFAWKDEETGVWLRARPDWMPADLSAALNVKTDVDASWSAFSRTIAKFGYAQSAALELDGYKAIFGETPDRFYHPVVEKPGEDWEYGDYIATALWELPFEDIERGRWLNRMAIRKFADCLAADKWPGYTDEPEECGLPGYARHIIDQGGAAEQADDDIATGGK